MVVPRGVLLWGEGERSGDNGASQGASEGVSDVKGDKNDDDDDELSTAVEVALCIDTKAKTYTLTVTGLGPLALIRWRRLQRLVQDAMLYRRHSMQLPSWMPYHREAMATSDVLKGAPPHSRLLHVPLPCDGMRTFKMSYLWHPLTPILSLSHPHYPTLSFPPSHSHPLFPAFSLPSSLSDPLTLTPMHAHYPTDRFGESPQGDGALSVHQRQGHHDRHRGTHQGESSRRDLFSGIFATQARRLVRQANYPTTHSHHLDTPSLREVLFSHTLSTEIHPLSLNHHLSTPSFPSFISGSFQQKPISLC